MGNRKAKANYRRTILRLPSRPPGHAAPTSAIEQFTAWYCSEPRLAFNRIVVVRYRIRLEERGLAAP